MAICEGWLCTSSVEPVLVVGANGEQTLLPLARGAGVT